MVNDWVYADKFAEECAEAEGGDVSHIISRTRALLEVIDIAIKNGKLKILASGKHGTIERPIDVSERGLSARDYRLKRSTAEAWFASDDDNSVNAPALETPKQRRARWLDWYGMGERGAVQSVYEREKQINPKADRPFIGKQIKIAMKEKADAQRAGTWTTQLVQDGKTKR